MSHDVYQPCPCGSGKKLKFCCFEKRKLLNHASPTELSKKATEFKVEQCLINDDWQESGLAQIVLVRQMPNLKYLMGIYLVDIFCLGLKDSFLRVNFKQEDVVQFIHRVPQQLIEISYEDVRSVVLGAIEYASQWRFEPNQGWSQTRYLVEFDRAYEKKFTFGKEGKPLYVQGPHDNVVEIMGKLGSSIKEGEAHFMVGGEANLFSNTEDEESLGLTTSGSAKLLQRIKGLF